MRLFVFLAPLVIVATVVIFKPATTHSQQTSMIATPTPAPTVAPVTMMTYAPYHPTTWPEAFEHVGLGLCAVVGIIFLLIVM